MLIAFHLVCQAYPIVILIKAASSDGNRIFWHLKISTPVYMYLFSYIFFSSAKENHIDVISGVVGLRLLLDTLRTVLRVRFSSNRQNIVTSYCQRSRKLLTNFLSNRRDVLVVLAFHGHINLLVYIGKYLKSIIMNGEGLFV